MDDAQILLAQIEQACQRLKMAQTTFGRLAVNDGKLVTRLQQGGRVTVHTVDRVHRFIEEQGGTPATTLRSAITGLRATQTARDFRFYDNRAKYLMFVNTTSEKQMIADRALAEMVSTQPVPPAIRLFDGGAGDGTALARILRGMHRRHPWVPFYVVAKEISMENTRLTLDKMPDRLQEHPATVLVMTNLKYSEAPILQPETPHAASAMVWHEVALEGSTAGEFEEQIAALDPFLARHWPGQHQRRQRQPALSHSGCAGDPRRDHRFLLEPVLPRRGLARADFDFALASQPYRARAPLSFKSQRVIAPLVRSLRPNGKLMAVHSHGHDPGLDIVRTVWPEENPFSTGRADMLGAIQQELGTAARDFDFPELTDEQALFRYQVRTLPGEVDAKAEMGSSTIIAAWNAASYVAQIEDHRLAMAMTNNRYLDATRDALLRHNGLWFNDEVYIVTRRPQLS